MVMVMVNSVSGGNWKANVPCGEEKVCRVSC